VDRDAVAVDVGAHPLPERARLGDAVYEDHRHACHARASRPTRTGPIALAFGARPAGLTEVEYNLPMAFRLTPHERGFYPLFTRAAENIARAADDLAELVAAPPAKRQEHADGVRAAEHAAG